VIGDRNTIREFCTFNIGSPGDLGVTRVGDDNWIMAYVHLAHDCQVGNHTIFANNTQLAGHVVVDDWVILGGFTVVHQFCRLGAHSFTAMNSLLFADLPPFVMAQGQPAKARSMNFEGLRRRGFSTSRIAAVKAMHKALYRQDLTLDAAQAVIAGLTDSHPEAKPDVDLMLDFWRTHQRNAVLCVECLVTQAIISSLQAPSGALSFAMVAGEPSGDLLGGLLLQGLRAHWPQSQSMGIGGPHMASHGFEAWWPCEKLAVRGYVEVLRHYREIVGIRRQLRDRLWAQKPDVFIGVDAPDFNLDLERDLKTAGVRTVHFVCPSVWAWRADRMAKIRQSVDHVLCIFLLKRHCWLHTASRQPTWAIRSRKPSPCKRILLQPKWPWGLTLTDLLWRCCLAVVLQKSLI